MDALLPALNFRGTPIGDRGEMLSLTDMWRAAKADKSRQPSEWLASADGTRFLDALGTILKPGISGFEMVTTVRGGREPGTWAHWQVAFAYAKYLSPDFHMWCNEVVRERMEGRLVPAPVAAIPDFANPAAAARAWAEQYEARQVAERTKAEIGTRREATAMNTASHAVKRVGKLEIELDRSREYATVKRMQLLYHGQEFSWRMLKHVSGEMSLPPIDVFDANYGTVKAYHADAWREAYALEILIQTETVQAKGASL